MLVYLYFIFMLSTVSGDETEGLLQMDNFSSISDREIIQQLITTVHSQQKRIEGLEQLAETVTTQQRRIAELEDVLAKQSDVIQELQRTLQDNGDIATEPLSATNDSQDSKTDKLPHEGVDKPSPRSPRISRRFISDTPVAFSALASHNMDHLGTNQNLIFEVTNVNTNNVYNPHHGVFTAPLTGVYVITSSVMANQDREVRCDMVVNGHVKAQIFARGTDNRYDQGSNTILLHLNKGDDVSIWNNLLDDSVYGSLYTTFSGFLLYEEEPTSIVG